LAQAAPLRCGVHRAGRLVMSLFDRLDTNHDGVLTRAEFAGAGLTAGHPAPLPSFPLSPSATVPAAPARYLPTEPLQVAQHYPAGVATSYVGSHHAAVPAPLPQHPPAVFAQHAPQVIHTAVAPPVVVQHHVAPPAAMTSMTPHPVGATTAAAHSPSRLSAATPVPVQVTSAVPGHATPTAPLGAALPQRAVGHVERSVSLATTAVAPSAHLAAMPAGTSSLALRGPTRAPLQPRLDSLGPNERVVGERPISREELASTGNLVEGPASEAIGVGTGRRPLAGASAALHGPGHLTTTSSSYAPPLSGSSALFDRLDRNHDGILTRAEFNQGLGGAPVAII